jgi:UDP-N-acetylmuramate--alanine ligase
MSLLENSTHIYLIGIGGSGLSAIALYLLERGYQVSGSDRVYSSLAKRVEEAGGTVFRGHNRDQLNGVNLVVRSSAIPDDNEEVLAAVTKGIPVYKRSDFLGRMMEGNRGIAVAGAHGKTTTTAMIAWILTYLGKDPSYIIGGVSQDLGTNAHAGVGSHFVIEADEYDRMFLGLNPDIAVITNIEYDHPDCFPTPEEFYQAFVEFVNRISPTGVLVVCSDDHNCSKLIEQTLDDVKTTYTYGLEPESDGCLPDYWGGNLLIETNGAYAFDIYYKDVKQTKVHLQIPGKHNVLNALAAFSVADQLNLTHEQVIDALEQFNGVQRRFEVRGESAGVVVIDDYAHHPTEIRATLSAVRERYPDREIWVVWQPHTYSRTRLLSDQFGKSFVDADHVLITKVYAAREAIVDDSFEEMLVHAVNHTDVRFYPSFDQIVQHLLNNVQTGSVLTVLSAGDGNLIGSSILETLSQRENETDV